MLCCVFLCSLFSLPSASSVPHLHLPNPGLSHTHLVQECVSLQSQHYAPNLPVASVCAWVCVLASICAPRCITEVCVHKCEYLYCDFPACLQHCVNTCCEHAPFFVCVGVVLHVGRWDTVQSQHHCADLPGSCMSF